MVRRVGISKVLNTFVVANTRQGILISSIGHTDSAQTSDTQSLGFGLNVFDSVNISDIVGALDYRRRNTLGDLVTPSDALDGVGDLPTYTLGKNLFESLTVLDSVGRVRGIPLADGATAVDLVSVPDGATYTLGKTETETLTSSELFARVAAFNRAITEASTISEVASLGFVMGTIADSAQSADNAVVSHGFERYFVDSANATDPGFVITTGSEKDVSGDSSNASDVILFSQGYGRLPSDSLTFSDVFTRVSVFKVPLADSAIAAELAALDVGLTLVDSAVIQDLIGVPDNSTFTLGMSEADSISSPTDIAKLNFGFKPSDSITMDSDALAFGMSLAKGDSASAVDLPALLFSTSFADAVTAEDSGGFGIGATTPSTTDVSSASDSAEGWMQSYFAQEYVLHTERYVETSYHNI